MIAVVLLVIGFGPVLNPPSPIAQAAQGGVRTELVWPEAKGISPQGSVSPDGKFVTYVDWLDSGNLAIRNLETGENRRLTQGTGVTGSPEGFSYAMWSSISPDGTQVVYQWNRPSPAGETGELRWLSLEDASTESRTIWSPEDGGHAAVQDWFPSGDRVAAVLRSSPPVFQIVTVSVTDGDVRQIRSIASSEFPRVRVSPDGRHIAYSRSASREQPAKDIFVVAVDGSSASTVIEHAANDELVGWSPKGDYLIINSDRSGKIGLWVQPLENAEPVGQLQLIVPNVDVAAGMGFTKDGSLYYHVRVSPQRLKIAAIDMRTGKFLTKPKDAVERFVRRNIQGTFSPDGAEFAYLSNRKESFVRTIVVRSLATGEEREVSHDLERTGSLIWPPDGESLLLQGLDDRWGYGLFSVGLANGQTELVAKDAAGGVLSQDGARLLHRDNEGERGSIYSYRLSDRSVERVPGDFGRGRFSALADGRIATIRDRTEILLHPAAGGEAKVLWRTDEDQQFGRWVVRTPDGKALVVQRRDPDAGVGMWRLWVAPVDGAPPYPTELVHEPSGAGSRPIKIHPDGKLILYGEGQPYSQIWAMRDLPFGLSEQAKR